MKNVILLSICSLFVFACSPKTIDDINRLHATAVSSGKQLKQVEEFIKLFPDAKHFVTYITQEEGPPVWNSVAGLWGRYRVSLQIPIKMKRDGTNVVPRGQGTIVVNEVVSILLRADGGANIEYGEQYRIDEPGWSRAVKDGTIERELGLRRGAPLPNFNVVLPKVSN